MNLLGRILHSLFVFCWFMLLTLMSTRNICNLVCCSLYTIFMIYIGKYIWRLFGKSHTYSQHDKHWSILNKLSQLDGMLQVKAKKEEAKVYT